MRPPAFQFYASDFLSGTYYMSQAEVGCYIRLLANQWDKGPLDADTGMLERLAGGPVPDVVLAKFSKTQDGKLFNERMEKVRKEQEDNSKRKSEGGKRGADARWHSHGIANATAMRPQCGGNATAMRFDGSPSPTPTPSPKIHKSVPPSPPAQPDLRLQPPAGDTGAEVRKVEKPKKPRERNPAFDALVEVGGGDPTQVTSSEGGRVAKALSEIRATIPGLSLEDLAAEIRRRAANYRLNHPDWELTCSALSTHWSSCDAMARQPGGKARRLETRSKSAIQEDIDQLIKAAEADQRQLDQNRALQMAIAADREEQQKLLANGEGE